MVYAGLLVTGEMVEREVRWLRDAGNTFAAGLLRVLWEQLSEEHRYRDGRGVAVKNGSGMGPSDVKPTRRDVA